MIPCSRVGHVFRKRRPYALGEKEDYMMYNSMRMARVWMDEYVVSKTQGQLLRCEMLRIRKRTVAANACLNYLC